MNLPPTQEKPNYSQFDLFVKRFKANHADMWQNDLKKEEGNKAFKKAQLSYFKDSSGLSKIPLYVESINNNINGKGFIIHFVNDNNYQSNDISYESHIDVFVLTKEAVAKSLIQKEADKYFITKYKKPVFVKPEMLRYLTGDRVWSANIELIKDQNDRIGIDGNSYGNWVVEAIEIKHS